MHGRRLAIDGGRLRRMTAHGAGHWHPHVMFFLPRAEPATWGANVDGSPIIAAPASSVEPYTVFMSLVPRWSDETSVTAR
jgi:hypothetical protein